jgi:ABC-type polysaccharide/polyol phosphate export permease
MLRGGRTGRDKPPEPIRTAAASACRQRRIANTRATLPKFMTASTTTYDSATRPGPVGLVVEGFKEAWGRRRLIGYLIRADLKKKGSDTVLGNLWWIIDPLLQMAVYVVLVTIIFAKSTPAYPLFIFSAILPWKWFTSVVNDSVVSVTGQEQLIKQVLFPKLILPVAAVLAGIANFAFGLIPLAGLLIFFYPDRISPMVVFIPVIAAVQLVFTLAVALFVAGVNVFFRDVGNVARHFLRLWFYMSPALYSASQMAEIGQKEPVIGAVLAANPFSPLFESYRNVIYSGTQPLFKELLAVLGVSGVLLLLALLFFKRVEPAFAKVL